MTRRRSLFWPVAGMLLLTVVVGTVLQWVIATAVLVPLESREARARAELALGALAGEIARAPAPPTGATLDTLLDRHRAMLGPRPAWIAVRTTDGHITTDPPDRARAVAGLFSGAAGDAAPPPGDRDRPRPEVVGRRALTRGAVAFGEAIVTRPTRPRGAAAFFTSRTSLLLLPIALFASVIVGLVMVRMLVRRLRGLERLAARVAEGDLDVRIADTSGDEIGRLAERLDRMTERLAEARDALATHERQRRQLFADITHELATPLTSIRGYAETMLDPGVSTSAEERTRYVRGTLEEAQRLDRLIRDLFDLARLEAGASALVREPLDWVALCRNTIERFGPRFRDAGLALVMTPIDGEAWIDADGRRIEQALDNLLVNALRYVPRGGTVTVGLTRDPARRACRLTVSDDGPGIAAEELPHVFERFYRASRPRGAERDEGGSGLGLAIVREIVERHGGRVSASPHAPHGLEIAIEIPARA